jgi:hypothetical protein
MTISPRIGLALAVAALTAAAALPAGFLLATLTRVRTVLFAAALLGTLTARLLLTAARLLAALLPIFLLLWVVA